MIDFGNVKLGAILGQKSVKNLRLSNYLATDLPEPPPVIDWISDQKKRLRMWANNEHGDCVFAAAYNMLSVASGHTGDPFKATDRDVLADYATVTGFDPVTGANDNGANPEDALRFYSKLPKGDQRRIEAWGEVNRFDSKELRQALFIFGGLYVAFALPKTAQRQIGKVWDVSPIPGPDRIPGSWGGHMMLAQMLDARGRKIIGNLDTWGTTQDFTQAFWVKYCTAAYFYITEKWVSDHSGKTPSGFDMQTLLRDVRELQAA